MVTATDPVYVISVFNQFKVPHKLKILAEGESLFNDAMALTMFSAFGLYLMSGQVFTIGYATTVSLEIFLGSTLVGLFIGLIGLFLLKLSKDIMSEFILILLIAYLSFITAEHFHIIGGNHLSGLLAEIVAIIMMTTIIDKSYERELRHSKKEEEILSEIGSNSSTYSLKRVKKITKNLITNITNIEKQKDISSFINVLAFLVNGILFVSLAHIIDFTLLERYKYEILSVFIATTIIRFLIIGVFSIGVYKTKIVDGMNIRWFGVLGFAGIKGGLSIVMLHMLLSAFPAFEYRDLFMAIVSGVIILTTFLYVVGLILIFSLNKNKFQEEYQH